jgi:hypothetical protein
MKSKYTHTQNRKSEKSKPFTSEPSDDLENMANELVSYADQKMRTGVLQGLLFGAEDDIKQEAVMLALRWYVKHKRNLNKDSEPWNAPRSLAIALRFIKRRYLWKIQKSPQTIHINDAPEGILDHPSNLQQYEWPADRMRTAVEKALSMTLKSGTISHANHVVARLVLIQNLSVSAAGLQLGLTRSAIYQHLKRVNKSIRPLIDQIEVPYH